MTAIEFLKSKKPYSQCLSSIDKWCANMMEKYAALKVKEPAPALTEVEEILKGTARILLDDSNSNESKLDTACFDIGMALALLSNSREGKDGEGKIIT